MKTKLLFLTVASAMMLPALSLASETIVFADFEDGGWGDWTVDGEAFSDAPAIASEDPRIELPGAQKLLGWRGKAFASSWNEKTGGDPATGRLTSREFRIEKPIIAFRIAGGDHKELQCINLVVDDKVVRTATGNNSDTLAELSWDVADIKGKTARIVIVDKPVEGDIWAHIGVDRIEFRDK